MRQADHAGHHLVGDLDRHARPSRRASATRAGRRRRGRARAASSGCISSVQRGVPFTRRWLLCIHELLLRSWRRPISSERRPARLAPLERARAGAARSARYARGRELDALVARCRARSGRRGSSGPRSTPCGARLSVASVRPSDGERRPCGPMRRPRSSDAARAEPAPSARAAQRRRRAERAVGAVQAARQLEADLPVVARVRRRARTAAASTGRCCAPRARGRARS